ncbi:MAG: hypothetical protein JSW49_01425 [candidate division WOR-3 bacterium]|nr:MAG: hypothetical protein JSW49_01425 [candidate division WOR-3 bacterium]
MISLMFLILMSADEAVTLTGTFDRMECHQNTLYLAPAIGTSIYRYQGSSNLNSFTFTDDVNYRIRSFKITPFAFYINRGTAIEKFYRVSGKKEIVFAAADITSFALTDAEEVIVADRQTRELIFLDRDHRIRFKIENVSADDIQWYDSLLYVLARNGIYVYDEHGTQVERRPIPQRCDRIIISDRHLFIFAANADHLFEADSMWVKKELPYAVADICVKDESIVTLDGTGTTLYFLDRNDF